MSAGQPAPSSPVFVIGSPRSGTTILAVALGEHPAFWTAGEFHLLSRLFGNGRLEQQLAGELLFPGLLQRARVTREELLAALGIGLDQLFTARAGGRRWVDQTPANVFLAEELRLLFPRARFVHLLRDGQDVVDSMLHFADSQSSELRARVERAGYVPEWAGDFTKACEMWRSSVAAGTRFAEAHPDRCRTVRYEQLVAQPEAVLRDLLAFLQVPDDPGPAQRIRGGLIGSSFGQDGAARRVGRERPDWTREQFQEFERIAGATQQRLEARPA